MKNFWLYLFTIVSFSGCIEHETQVKEANYWDGVYRLENDEVVCYRYRDSSGYAGMGGLSCKWKDK